MVKPTILDKATFNSDLKVSKDLSNNHVLKLRLGLHVEKIHGTPDTFRDLDSNVFKIRNWEDFEWFGFWHTILDQCEMWNNQFWLIPPKSFSALDIAAGDISFRPNVKCELFVQLWSHAGDAQKNIKVAKLADSVTGDSAVYRSTAVTYDSLDGVAHTFQIPDSKGVKTKITHYTIPHEIGHALGQPHIGQLRKTDACMKAIKGNPSDEFANGGSNSNRCYGYGEDPSIAENIMGFGTKFEEVNAQPWVDRIAAHTGTKASEWQVKLSEMPPFIAPPK